MFEIHASLDVNLDPNDILARFGLEEHGRVQKAIDNAVIRYMEPYWAYDSGTLVRGVYTATDIGSGTITYPGPYAHYMYYGVLYTDELGRVFVNKGEKKPVNTGIPLEYKKSVHQEAGSFPFVRMKADHMEDILEEARRVARDQ